MRWHTRIVISGEVILAGIGGMVETWFPVSSGWLWAGVTSLGLLIILEWLVHKRIVGAVTQLWNVRANRRLSGLQDAIRHELECIENTEGSEFSRAAGRGALARKLEKLKIPCPHPRREATWRVFLAGLLICSSDGTVAKARTLFADLHTYMLEKRERETS